MPEDQLFVPIPEHSSYLVEFFLSYHNYAEIYGFITENELHVLLVSSKERWFLNS
jgi:hypothetical protein